RSSHTLPKATVMPRAGGHRAVRRRFFSIAAIDSDIAFTLVIYLSGVMKKQVVIGMLGTTLDGGLAENRWERWRPTVDLCRHEDLVVDRFELLYQAKFERLATVVRGDIASVSPETAIRIHHLEFKDPWDFEEVYGGLHDFARAYRFD